MAEGGFGERDPLLENTDDRDDDDRDNDTTTPFVPNGASTPAPPEGDPMTTNLPTERGPETSFTEGLPEIPGGFSSTTFTAVGQLDKEFPDAKKENLKYRINTKNGRLQVGLLNTKKPYYDLATKKPGTDKYQINPSLPKEVLKELGVCRRQTLGKEIKKLTEDIFNNKKIADDQGKSKTERNKARERAKRQIAKRTDLWKELNLLKNTDYEPTRWETIQLEEFQQNQEERLERQKEIQQEREDQEEIVNDENEEPVVREQARKRIEELEIENNQIENENERELERLPFREKLRERVKEIFKKYGVTVTAILLAAGVTIGAVIGAITNSLKALGKGVGNGLKEIGEKTASLLPGLIGQIASFLFKTAGQVISFLAEHTWLLILAAVAFVAESYIKKRR